MDEPSSASDTLYFPKSQLGKNLFFCSDIYNWAQGEKTVFPTRSFIRFFSCGSPQLHLCTVVVIPAVSLLQRAQLSTSQLFMIIRFLNSSTIYNSPFLARCITFEHNTLVMCCHNYGQLVRFWLSNLPAGQSVLDFYSLPDSKERSLVWSDTSGVIPGGIRIFH